MTKQTFIRSRLKVIMRAVTFPVAKSGSKFSWQVRHHQMTDLSSLTGFEMTPSRHGRKPGHLLLLSRRTLRD
jgi:hypothetical protein